MKTNSAIPAAGEAVPAAPTITDLEGPALDAERYASVLFRLIDKSLGQSHENVTGHPNKYWLVDDEVDDIIFIAARAEAATAMLNQILQRVLK